MNDAELGCAIIIGGVVFGVALMAVMGFVFWLHPGLLA